ncbi:type IV secretory system conjugative DNA transfer family protein [Pseudomonas aeruginosa]
MTTKYTDTATRGGNKWFHRWLNGHMAVFAVGGWIGYYLSTFLWWRHLDIVNDFGRWGHSFWHSMLVVVPLGYLFHVLQMKWQRRSEQKEAEQVAAANAKTPEEEAIERAEYLAARRAGFTGLEIGTSTGELLERRGHKGGLPSGTPVVLSPEDCAKNIIAFGGIGSGKTSRFINPLMLQLMEQNAGALVLDIKTDFQREVAAITAHVGREYKTVGDGGMTLNLLRGTTPELAASFLKSCFLAQGTGDSQIWADLATEHCRNCLTLIKLTGSDYSLAGLYDIAVDDKARKALIEQAEAAFDGMSDRDQRLQMAVSRYFTTWDGYDERQKSSVMVNVNSVLTPFSHPDLVDAFSTGSEQGEADLTELINDGAVFLVNLPQTKFGKEGARYAYLLIKLRFFNMMRERRTRDDWNQTRPVAFVCDEYQSIVDSVSDTDFWDKSRSSKTIGIVSMQGVASLTQALNGNHKAAEAILQNFRQRVVFRTEDEATLRHVQHLLGQIDVVLTSSGESYSESVSWTGLGMGGRQPTQSQSISESENASMTRQDLFSANDMRALSADYCLLIGNIGDRAADEVLQVAPLYIN